MALCAGYGRIWTTGEVIASERDQVSEPRPALCTGVGPAQQPKEQAMDNARIDAFPTHAAERGVVVAPLPGQPGHGRRRRACSVTITGSLGKVCLPRPFPR